MTPHIIAVDRTTDLTRYATRGDQSRRIKARTSQAPYRTVVTQLRRIRICESCGASFAEKQACIFVIIANPKQRHKAAGKTTVIRHCQRCARQWVDALDAWVCWLKAEGCLSFPVWSTPVAGRQIFEFAPPASQAGGLKLLIVRGRCMLCGRLDHSVEQFTLQWTDAEGWVTARLVVCGSCMVDWWTDNAEGIRAAVCYEASL